MAIDGLAGLARKLYQRQWCRTHPRVWNGNLAHKVANKKWKLNNPEKQHAQGVVKWLLESGQIVKPSTCSRCGTAEKKGRDGRSLLQAHHPDYSKPKEVVWVCAPCHGELHLEASRT
jgi:hypothetical protein